MAYTQQDLANIDSCIAAGELTVEHNGRRVTYRSTSELMQQREFIKSQIDNAAASASTTRRGAYRVAFTTIRE